MKKVVYLANAYGFSMHQKASLLPQVVERLEYLDLEVWEPFARRSAEMGVLEAKGWARKIALANAGDVIRCDGVVAIVNGTPPDEGVCVELGMAFALGKPCWLFRDDFRRCSDSDEFPLNLMLLAGLPGDWRLRYYNNVNQLGCDGTDLAKWAKGV